MKRLLSLEGIQVEVLTTEVPPEWREAWYGKEMPVATIRAPAPASEHHLAPDGRGR